MSNSYDKYKQQRAERKAIRQNRRKRREENKFFANLKLFVLTCAALMLAGFVALNLYLSSLPPIANLQDFKPNIVTQFFSEDGEIIKTFTAYSYDKVELKDVPDHLKNALIATEDKNFYRHGGYDIVGIIRSSIQNVIARQAVQGASTLTQQLARILFLSNERTLTRKIKELEVAARIEKTISKDDILEMYMNNVYLGAGAYGVSAASKIYFNKKLNQLTLPELALIAGLPQAPSVYNPYNNKDLAIQRRNQVLKRMLTRRYITKDEYKKAIEADVKLSSVPQIYTTNKAPYFSDYVINEMIKLGFDESEIIHGGYKVITTLNSKAQDVANESILRNMKAWGMTGKSQQAAVFSFNALDGRILVYAGGKNYGETQYDRVQSIRPPGSAFKPIVYAAALEKGVTPNDMILDAPVTIGNWSPRNYGNKYRGKIPVYKALMVSSNVCAARVIKEVGIRPVIQLARVLGITTPLEYDYTISLGSNGVKLFEFVRAYGAFANGGYVVQPYAIERIEDSRGRVLYRAGKTKSTHQLSLKTAAEMTAMLKTVIQSGTGVAANIGKPAAGKTGTTDDYKDAYFVGYTPEIVTGVWVGDDNNKKMGGLTGGTVPAKIWKDIMTVATKSSTKTEFDYPAIELVDYGKDARLIGDDEQEDEQTTEGEVLDGEVVIPVGGPATVGDNPKSLTPADVVKNFNQQHPQNAKESVVDTSKEIAPIPMAVPESLR
ncbi:MAG: PBP1A family penicillin-binding protein [Cyanobacteria bacterium SIG26]|nr:PBP1A family penicillin-binding protein [Cyanobacteria bacterium SIG26]